MDDNQARGSAGCFGALLLIAASYWGYRIWGMDVGPVIVAFVGTSILAWGGR
jgi:hypothetical protein